MSSQKPILLLILSIGKMFMLKKYLEEKKKVVEQELDRFLKESLEKVWLEKNIGKLRFKFEKNQFSAVKAPIEDLLSRGGKRWRPIFMLLCYEALGGKKDIAEFIPVIELIHNGTLIIDDIEDDSRGRRGKPCIHKIWGVDVAINAGNMAYFLPLLMIKNASIDDKKKNQLYEVVVEEMVKLHIGQGLDIYWHNGGLGTDEELYLQMCAFKTGTLARMAARFASVLGNASDKQSAALARFAESIGVAFQIQDDILNITNTSWGKEFGEDISEGKRSLMVIRALEIGKEEDKKILLTILNKKTKEKESIQSAIKIIERYDAIKYAKEKARSLVESAWSEVDPLLKNSQSKKTMKEFAEYLVQRSN